MAEDSGLSAVKTDVAILKKDISNIHGLLTRLDTSIDKIADASTGISKILAVHDSKIVDSAEERAEMTRMAEKSIELIHKRISDKDEEHKALTQENHTKLMAFLQDHDDRSNNTLENISTRVRALEQWKWVVVGGGIVLGFVLSEMSIITNIIQ